MKDLLRKLSSRKFWSALVGFITSILIAYNVPQSTIAQVTAIVTAGGVLAVYIMSESIVDAAHKGDVPSEEKKDQAG